jgi:hypothetical protein
VVPSSTGRAFRPSRGDARRAGALPHRLASADDQPPRTPAQSRRGALLVGATIGARGCRRRRAAGACGAGPGATSAVRSAGPARLLGRVRAHASGHPEWTGGHLGAHADASRWTWVSWDGRSGWKGGRDRRPERRRVSIAPDTRVDTLGRSQAPAWNGRGLLGWRDSVRCRRGHARARPGGVQARQDSPRPGLVPGGQTSARGLTGPGPASAHRRGRAGGRGGRAGGWPRCGVRQRFSAVSSVATR